MSPDVVTLCCQFSDVFGIILVQYLKLNGDKITKELLLHKLKCFAYTNFMCFFRHLIGFFLFLALTIYTATKVPKVVDLQSIQHLPDFLRKADLKWVQSELMACLPSLPHLSNLNKLKQEIRNSVSSIEMLPSISRWHVLDLLSNCFLHRFTSTSNQTNISVLVSCSFFTDCLILNGA
jgi:hypothetical protein